MTSDVPIARRRRWIVPAAAAIGGLGLAGVAAWWASTELGTCGLFDRVFGGSGCVASYGVDDFHPLSWQSLTVQPGGEAVSLFGRTRTADGWQTAMLTLDLATGEEAGRHPVPALHEPVQIRVSQDGRRVTVFCDNLSTPCIEGGHQAIVVSPEDARPLASSPTWDYDNAGRPTIAAEFAPVRDWATYYAVLMPDGEQVAAHDDETGEVVLRAMPDGDEVRRLQAVESFPFDQCIGRCWELVPSPSGRWLAAVYVDEVTRPSRSFIRIWDMESGAGIAAIPIDYTISLALAWTPDERQVVTVTQSARRTESQIDVFALP